MGVKSTNSTQHWFYLQAFLQCNLGAFSHQDFFAPVTPLFHFLIVANDHGQSALLETQQNMHTTNNQTYQPVFSTKARQGELESLPHEITSTKNFQPTPPPSQDFEQLTSSKSRPDAKIRVSSIKYNQGQGSEWVLTIAWTHSLCTGVGSGSPVLSQSPRFSRAQVPCTTGSLASSLCGKTLQQNHGYSLRKKPLGTTENKYASSA